MAVLGSQHFQQRDRFREGLNPLPRAIRHIDRCDSIRSGYVHFGAFGYEIENHLVIAARRRIMDRRKTTAGQPPKRVRLLLLNGLRLWLRLRLPLRLALSLTCNKFAAETASVICRIHIEVKIFDKILHGRHTSRRSVDFIVAMCSRARGDQERIHAILVRNVWIGAAG